MCLLYLFRSIVIFVIVKCVNADQHANSYEGFIENKHPIQLIYITQENGTFNNNYTPSFTDGISYSELLLKQQYVIDKTLLVEALTTASRVPTVLFYGSKWGKTTNINMIREFYEIELDENKKIIPQKNTKAYKFFVKGKLTLMDGKEISFHPFLISKRTEIVENYLAAYPVSFSHVISRLFKRHSYVTTPLYELVKNTSGYQHIGEAYDLEKFHSYLYKKANSASLLYSLTFLSELLYNYHGKKVLILIDEYDDIYNKLFLNVDSEYVNEQDVYEILSFIRCLMASTFRENEHIYHGIITGVSRFFLDTMHSGFNAEEFSIFTPKVNLFYGIMKNELDLLLKLFPEMKTQENSINLKYNGYLIENENFETRACNPYSITQCLGNRKLDDYWVNGDYINWLCKTFLIEDYFRNYITYLLLTTEGNIKISVLSLDFIARDFIAMKKYFIRSEEKKQGINKAYDKHDTLKLLITRSYFSTRKIDRTTYELSIPNDEVRTFLRKIVLSFLITYRLRSSTHELDQLKIDFESLILVETPNVKEFEKSLQTYLDTIPANVEKPNMDHRFNLKASFVNEELYYDILTSMALLLHPQRIGTKHPYDYKSKTKPDIYLIWKHYVVIVKVKYGIEENDAKALNQAKGSRSYVEKLLDKHPDFFRYIIIRGHENKTANIILHDEKHHIDQVIDIVQCTDEMKTEELGILNYDKLEKLSIIVFKNNETWWTAKKKNEERGLIQAKHCSPIAKEAPGMYLHQ